MSSDPPWKTVLIEEQALLRNLITKSLRLDDRFELLAEVEDGAEGRILCLRLVPDLVVMDVQLARMDGIGLARDLLQSLPKVRLLVLSQLKDAFTLNRLSEIGVHGFVEKDQSLEILEEAMVEVASGRRYFTATLCRNQERLRSDPRAFSKILNAKEQEILWCVAQGWTSKAIARRLNMSPRSFAARTTGKV
ncbi:MAG: response regulator transcription factor [Verrucomicrobiales bacterium]|nr:response regulator transcription factor [Verrucomicrobiales bacterium]